MRTVCLTILAGAIVMSVSARAQDGRTLDAAAHAMGATGLNSIRYSGDGLTYGFGQAPGPGEPWPLFVAKTYSMTVDYQMAALHRSLFERRENTRHAAGLDSRLPASCGPCRPLRPKRLPIDVASSG